MIECLCETSSERWVVVTVVVLVTVKQKQFIMIRILKKRKGERGGNKREKRMKLHQFGNISGVSQN
jgi:hypothetical protein